MNTTIKVFIGIIVMLMIVCTILISESGGDVTFWLLICIPIAVLRLYKSILTIKLQDDPGIPDHEVAYYESAQEEKEY